MKLKLIPIFLCFTIFGFSQVEVIENGNVEVGVNNTEGAEKLNVYGTSYFSGNVGIGINDPQHKLQVNGGARILDARSSTNINSSPALGGWRNVYIGLAAGNSTGGNYNTGLGTKAGQVFQTGTNNVFVGRQAGFQLLTGESNIMIGGSTGTGVTDADNCVFIGHGAGSGAVGDNKLYIHGKANTPALIYGEFDNRLLQVRSTLSLLHWSGPNEFYIPEFNFLGNESQWTFANEGTHLTVSSNISNGQFVVDANSTIQKPMRLNDIMVLTPTANIPMNPSPGVIYMDDGANTGGVMTLRFWNGTGWVNLN